MFCNKLTKEHEQVRKFSKLIVFCLRFNSRDEKNSHKYNNFAITENFLVYHLQFISTMGCFPLYPWFSSSYLPVFYVIPIHYCNIIIVGKTRIPTVLL